MHGDAHDVCVRQGGRPGRAAPARSQDRADSHEALAQGEVRAQEGLDGDERARRQADQARLLLCQLQDVC